MPFRHIALFRFADHVTPEMVEQLGAALTQLPSQIEELRNYVHGPDLGVSEGNFDYAVVADLDDVDGYVAYRDHPAHVALIEKYVKGNVAERAAVQLTF
jgi:hypothetical protein